MKRQAVQVAAALAGGLLLGLAAWGEQRAPVLALLLPAALALCGTRLQAFALAAGYAGGVLRYAVTFIGSWFADSVAVGLGAVIAYMLVSGAAWSVGWSGSPVAWKRALHMAVGWLVALVPAAIALPGHPLVATGFVLPGAGWVGVILSLASAAAFAGVVPAQAARMSRRAALALTASAFVGLAGLGLVAAQVVASQPAQTAIAGMRTSWGPPGDGVGVDRITAMGSAPTPPSASVVAWPESVIGLWEPSLFAVMQLEILNAARTAGRTVIVGMDLGLVGQRYLNSAVAFYPDGTSQSAVARQPAPLSLWRPWRFDKTFLADWGASNVLQLGDDRAAVIFCYEEYMPVLYLLNELRDRPTVYLALANTWAARQRTAASIQTWHSLGMARLFGRPYIKAENQPLEAAGGLALPREVTDRPAGEPVSVAPGS
jgi:hypothetical protein